MKKSYYLIVVSVLLASTLLVTNCSQQSMQALQNTISTIAANNTLSNSDVIAGLKEALTVGAKQAVATSSVTDGFFNNSLIRIPFPEQAIKVKETLQKIGMSKQVENFEKTLNNAAETASKEAFDILAGAVKELTIQDGFNILNGGDTAATHYLREKTTAPLREKFTPLIQSAIEKVNLTAVWKPLVNAYNMVPGVEKQNPNLEEYITNKTIDGLMTLIAQEEKQIREDPAARVSDILKKVFGSVDKK